jgi:23S rRNA pseudouridine1911/1915/1917 synthase
LNRISIKAPENWIGQRLDKALGNHPEIQTRTKAQWLIDNDCVQVNNKVQKSSYKVSAQDSIEINLPEPKPTDLVPLHQNLDVVFEDEELIVINKPSGLVVHPAAGHEQDTLVNMLLAHTKKLSMRFGENRPGIVHRLDMDTSGLIVVAKNDHAHESLASQFKNKTTERVYWAVSVNAPKLDTGKIQSLLARHPSDRKKYASTKNAALGKIAVTNYKVLQRLNGLCSLELRLETGRTHQIRVHMREQGCPLLADPIYGVASGNGSKNKIEFPRLALHACVLGFVHPSTGETKRFFRSWPVKELKILTENNFVFENRFGI